MPELRSKYLAIKTSLEAIPDPSGGRRLYSISLVISSAWSTGSGGVGLIILPNLAGIHIPTMSSAFPSQVYLGCDPFQA